MTKEFQLMEKEKINYREKLKAQLDSINQKVEN
jgi:hypothetical protein